MRSAQRLCYNAGDNDNTAKKRLRGLTRTCFPHPPATLQRYGEDMQPFRSKVNAPAFPPGLDWLNVDQPLTMADLRGKLVLLEFWTFC